MYDAIVLGGGIVGLSAAYHLVGAGARALLLDRADPGRATSAGAGIISPATNTRDPGPWFDFAVHAAAYYPELIAQLEQAGAGETGYAQPGLLLVAVSRDEAPLFEQARDIILGRQRRRGWPTPDDLHEVAPDEARRMFPLLAPVVGALFNRLGARVDGRLLAEALRRAAEQRGLVVKPMDAQRLVIEGGRVTGVAAAGETIAAPSVVIAGGAWSARFGEQLGIRIPVEPQRGQIIHLRLPPADTAGWPVISGFRGHYLVPWPDHRVVAGASRETGSGFAPHLTAAGVAEVLTEAMRVAPGLAQAEIAEMRVGLRPLSPDGLPILGAVPGVDGVYLATGHGPTGLTLGPLSGKVIADLALGHDPGMDLDPFGVTRFLR